LEQSVSLKRSLLLATALLASGPALAQSVNWTGPYVGVGIGFATVDETAPGKSESGVLAGINAGYDYDLGSLVIGAGVDLDFTGSNLGIANLDRIWRLKLRTGIKTGSGLFYATGGYANANVSSIADADGYFFGGGYEHRVNQNFSIGAEVLYHKFDNCLAVIPASDVNIEFVTVQLRGAYRF
jgi:opacity protein-like surface antigen